MPAETAALTRSVQFDWQRRVPRDPRKQAELLVDAVEALAGIVAAPRRYDLGLALRDSDDLPPRWSWTVAAEGEEDPVFASEAEVVQRVATVDRGAFVALAREAFTGRTRTAVLLHASAHTRWRRHRVTITLWSLQGLSLEMDWPEVDEAAAQIDIARAAEALEKVGWAVAVDDEPHELEDDGPVARRGPVSIELMWRGADRRHGGERAGVACDAIASLVALGAPQGSVLLLSFQDAAGRPRRTAHQYSGLGAEELRAAVVEALAPQRASGLRGLVRGARAVTWLNIGVELGAGGPVRVRFWNQDELTLELELRSPEFADPASAGRDRVEQAVSHLAQAGWKRALRAD
jgi:hypothetical protein